MGAASYRQKTVSTSRQHAFPVCRFARLIHITNFWFWFLQEERIKKKLIVFLKSLVSVIQKRRLNFWITKKETERMIHMIYFCSEFYCKIFHFNHKNHLLVILIMLVTFTLVSIKWFKGTLMQIWKIWKSPYIFKFI